MFIFLRFDNEHVHLFLENFETVAQKHEQRRQKIKKDVNKKIINSCFILLFSFIGRS